MLLPDGTIRGWPGGDQAPTDEAVAALDAAQVRLAIDMLELALASSDRVLRQGVEKVVRMLREHFAPPPPAPADGAQPAPVGDDTAARIADAL